MLRLGDTVRINAGITRVEKALEEDSNSSIGKVMNEWIADPILRCHLLRLTILGRDVER
jgi:hypothetical protein